MKFIRKTNLLLFFFIGLILISCNNDNSHFNINESELRNLILDDRTQSSFIDNWNLTLCYKNTLIKRYCYQDSILQFEILIDQGYILSINGLKFLKFEKLISSMKEQYENYNVEDIPTYQHLIIEYKLEYGRVFRNSEYEIVILKESKKDLKSYTIIANKL